MKKSANEMTKEELELSATRAREMAQKLSREGGVTDTTPVVYGPEFTVMKMEGVWWVMMIAHEKALEQHAITMIPYQVLFQRTNDILAYIAATAGEKEAMKFVDNLDFLSPVFVQKVGDTTGEDSPTIN